MNNPKFVHTIESKNNNSSISLNSSSINNCLLNDWDVIYEYAQSIDFDEIFKIIKFN